MCLRNFFMMACVESLWTLSASEVETALLAEHPVVGLEQF